MDKRYRLLAALTAALSLAEAACAEDLLKPLIETFYNAIKALFSTIMGFIYAVFPGLEDSFAANPFGPLNQIFPGIEALAWIFYLAVFFVAIAVIAKLWSMGKQFIINTLVGVLLLLILIHILGVEIQISLLNLIITAVFGIPGVILILILHYLGIPI